MNTFYITDNIPLTVKGLASNTSLGSARILVLQEAAGERLFPVLLGEEEYDVLESAMLRQSFHTVTMMLRLAKTAGYKLESVKLLGARDGKQLTELLFANSSRRAFAISKSSRFTASSIASLSNLAGMALSGTAIVSGEFVRRYWSSKVFRGM